uniref:Cyclin-Q n=1 Tax=Glossina brevipalpis TaxID=37001 RepID=A0A1A9X4T7_9MUSC
MEKALSSTENVRSRVTTVSQRQQSESNKQQKFIFRGIDMENLIDVLSLQTRVQENKSKRSNFTNYREIDKIGIVPRFLFESAIKLELTSLTSASAAIIYHRFFKEASPSHYDKFLIATSSLYIATKIKDDPVNIRDVVNVTHNLLNRNAAPLDLGEEYWSRRDAIVQAELLITRMLKFNLCFEQPHKFLLCYLRTLQDWVGSSVWNSAPIAKVAMSFLQDFHHSPKILDYKVTHVAIGCLSLALQTYGIQVPLTNESSESSMWYTSFVPEMNKKKQWQIIEDIIEVYNNELEIDKCQFSKNIS